MVVSGMNFIIHMREAVLVKCMQSQNSLLFCLEI